MNKLKNIWIHKDIIISSTYHLGYHYKYIGFALLTTNQFNSDYYDIIFPKKITLIKTNNFRNTYYKDSSIAIQSFNKELLNNLLSEGTIYYI
jgi:hypothetical protein